MKESLFQRKVCDRIREILPDCVVIKSDAGYIQGFPDIIVLNGERWAVLEFKKNASSHHQPNQDYYIDLLGRMSFAAFIFPENEEDVLNDLRKALSD